MIDQSFLHPFDGKYRSATALLLQYSPQIYAFQNFIQNTESDPCNTTVYSLIFAVHSAVLLFVAASWDRIFSFKQMPIRAHNVVWLLRNSSSEFPWVDASLDESTPSCVEKAVFHYVLQISFNP